MNIILLLKWCEENKKLEEVVYLEYLTKGHVEKSRIKFCKVAHFVEMEYKIISSMMIFLFVEAWGCMLLENELIGTDANLVLSFKVRSIWFKLA